jgi:BirA family biotin operon repressor/biotin-[acetyl-CoA-carboxylase] ligase
LIHGEAKVSGILVELSGDALGPSLAIVGVGLNVRLPAALKRGIGQAVTDLAAVGGRPVPNRNRLLAHLASEIVKVLEGYAQAGFAPLRAAWQRRHAYQGKPVQIVLPDGGTVRGVVVGVDAAGALLLDSAGRRLRCVSGEVSLRRL